MYPKTDLEEQELLIMHFDRVLEDYFGIVSGKDSLVYIKTGKGGTVYGRDNKYLSIAKRINEQYGYTVAISANPVEYDCDLGLELDYLNEIPETGSVIDVYYVGVSNGAIIGATQGCYIKRIQKMLLINGPLMINYHKTVKGIKAFGGKPIDFVYGENDPSNMYTVLLENEKICNCNISIVANADHNFLGMEDVFENMIVKWCGRNFYKG